MAAGERAAPAPISPLLSCSIVSMFSSSLSSSSTSAKHLCAQSWKRAVEGIDVVIDVKYGSSNVSIHDNQVARVNSVGIYVDAWSEYQHDIQVYNNKRR
jgi:hypothetical protein